MLYASIVAAFGEDYVTCGARWLGWGGATWGISKSPRVSGVNCPIKSRLTKSRTTPRYAHSQNATQRRARAPPIERDGRERPSDMCVMASPVSLRVLFGSPLHRFWLLLWRAFGACACMHETMKDDVLRRWVCFDPGLDFGVGPSPHPLISPAGWWERWPLINFTNGSSRWPCLVFSRMG